MSNSCPISKNFAKAFLQKDQHQSKPSSQEYAYGLTTGHETRMKSPKPWYLESSQRNGSRPKLEYLRFESETLTKSKERPKGLQFTQQQSRIDNCQGVRNRQKDCSKQERQARLQGQKSQKYIYQKQRSKIETTLDHKYDLSNNNNKYLKDSQCPQQKLQITFNIDSTEPEQCSKEKIASIPMIKSEYYCDSIYTKTRIDNKALEIWKKRKIERDIKEKQTQYRSLIRSLSKSQQKQRKAIQSKMKEVISDIFQLQKTIKNG